MNKNHLLLVLSFFVAGELHGNRLCSVAETKPENLRQFTITTKYFFIVATTTVLLVSLLWYKFFFKKKKQHFLKHDIKFNKAEWDNAIRNGDEKVVQDYLEAKIADLDKNNEDGYFPIHIAAMHNQDKIIEIFLRYRKQQDRGNDYYINLPDGLGRSPLISALESDPENINAVKCLIFNGANINLKSDKFEKSPLEIAREIDEKNGNKKMEELLNGEVAKRVQREQPRIIPLLNFE